MCTSTAKIILIYENFTYIFHGTQPLNYPSLQHQALIFFLPFGNDSINIKGYKHVKGYICPLNAVTNFLCIYNLSIINYHNYTRAVFIFSVW